MQKRNRAFGVDISRWQDNYKDDGIDEGLPLDFVIQKFGQGYSSYTLPNHTQYKRWLSQYNSIEHFEIKGGYFWYETEIDPIKQGIIFREVDKKKLYDFLVVDFEAYQNVVSPATIQGVKRLVDWFKENSDTPIVIYTNGWVLALMYRYLGNWMDKQDLWFAGGSLYNERLTAPLPDHIMPPLPVLADGQWKLWQYSADKNYAADELDFGEYELGSIDYNVYNGTLNDMRRWLGKPLPDDDLPGEGNCEQSYIEGHNQAMKQLIAWAQDKIT